MVSNISLEITALAFTLFVLYHFLMEKKVNDASNKIFTFFITVGIMDICFDVISTILIEQFPGRFVTLTKACLTVLYLLQAILPYAVVRYTQSLLGGRHVKPNRWSKCGYAVTCLVGMLAIINFFTGFFFYYDDANVYHQGPLYLLMYVYVGLYMSTVAVISVVNRHELTFREFASIWEYLIIIAISVLIQLLTGTLLTIGVGIGLGITMLYITISNPNSNVDTFTGLPDKAYFAKWMEERVVKGLNVNVVAVELFKLKWLNKVYGPAIADKMILKLVDEINEYIGTGHLFRISGRRFLVEVGNNDEYNFIMMKLQKKFDTPVSIDGDMNKLPAILCGVPDAQRLKKADELIEYIDYMVALTGEGEDTIVIKDKTELMEGFRKEQEIEKFLDTAVEEDLFQVYYQPVYSVKDKKVVTLEALSRLVHPSIGHIPPDVFIAYAEKNGLIEQISKLQLKRVCDFVKNNEALTSSIENVKFNLSPHELLKEGHCRELVRIIRDSGLKPEYFNFEITETVATEYSDIVRGVIGLFNEAGIGLCLDDFGAGYANLNTVLKMPFSTIKIDRSLLGGMLDDENVAEFYERIVSILNSMGYRIVAEGVETKEEFELLSKWNVDMIQGFYFSKPLAEKEIIPLLKEN
ncbi:MAG: EAL domain-containing protein [Eubacterium sp.]|nr:EAL domain-containing protein [Candidatus Colimonas fimequi]